MKEEKKKKYMYTISDGNSWKNGGRKLFQYPRHASFSSALMNMSHSYTFKNYIDEYM